MRAYRYESRIWFSNVNKTLSNWAYGGRNAAERLLNTTTNGPGIVPGGLSVEHRIGSGLSLIEPPSFRSAAHLSDKP